MEQKMSGYKMKDFDLFDNTGRKIAAVKGNDIYNSSGQRVAKISGQEVYNAHGQKVATVKGTDIYDSHSIKIGNLNEVRNTINDAAGGVSLAALWYFFVR